MWLAAEKLGEQRVGVGEEALAGRLVGAKAEAL
jgi:hypothetical protein